MTIFDSMLVESLEQKIRETSKLVVVLGSQYCCKCRTTFNKISHVMAVNHFDGSMDLIGVDYQSPGGVRITEQATQLRSEPIESITLTAYYLNGTLVYWSQGVPMTLDIERNIRAYLIGDGKAQPNP